MLKQFIILSSLLLTISVVAQTKSTNEIVAEGMAKVKITPDIAVLTLTVEKTDSVEKNAIASLNTQMESLSSILKGLGFSQRSIQISEYGVTSSRDEETNKKRATASNTIKVEFPLDNKVINSFYKAIQNAGGEDLDISFDTKLSDSLEKKTRQILVVKAIEDAKSKATVISGALGVKLLRVKQVRKYAESTDEISTIEIVKFTAARVVGDNELRHNTLFDQYQVEQVELEEKITIVYEISS